MSGRKIRPLPVPVNDHLSYQLQMIGESHGCGNALKLEDSVLRNRPLLPRT